MKINNCYACGGHMKKHVFTTMVDKGCIIPEDAQKNTKKRRKLDRPYFVLICSFCQKQSLSGYSLWPESMESFVVNHWNNNKKLYQYAWQLSHLKERSHSFKQLMDERKKFHGAKNEKKKYC